MMVYGCSTIGGSYHEICQDYSIAKQIRDGVVTLIVADGVGEAMFSQDGSKAACETLMEYLSDRLTDEQMEEWDMDTEQNMIKNVIDCIADGYIKSLNRIKEISEEKETNLSEFATTLTMLLRTPKGVFWGHCGDGAILSIDPDGCISMLTAEQSGMLYGEVYPLHMGREYWSFGFLPLGAAAFVLTTDGVLSYLKTLLKGDETNIKKYFNVLLGKAREKKQISLDKHVYNMIKLPALESHTRDDKTMALFIEDMEHIPSFQDYYFGISDSLIPYNVECSVYGESLSEYLQQVCRNSVGIVSSEYLSSWILRHDNAFIFLSCYSMEFLVNACEEEGLYKCQDYAKHGLANCRLLYDHYKTGRNEIEDDAWHMNSDCMLARCENIPGIVLELHGYKDFLMAAVHIDERYLEEDSNVLNMLASYRYQWGALLFKVVCMRKYEVKDETISPLDMHNEIEGKDLCVLQYTDIAKKYTDGEKDGTNDKSNDLESDDI